MHILLINTNPVVSRLISLNTHNDTTIQIDEISGGEKAPRQRYDVVFVDEKCCNADMIRAYIQTVTAGEKVLFSTEKKSSIEGIDRVISKPFLPSEISTLLQMILPNINAEAEEDEEREEEESLSAGNEPILDSGEIEKIKQILLDEEMGITETGEEEMERESVIALEEKGPKKRKKKKKMSKKLKKKMSFEENLLEALTEMKPRQIRKLLEGAEVSIAIRFPKGV